MIHNLQALLLLGCMHLVLKYMFLQAIYMYPYTTYTAILTRLCTDYGIPTIPRIVVYS